MCQSYFFPPSPAPLLSPADTWKKDDAAVTGNSKTEFGVSPSAQGPGTCELPEVSVSILVSSHSPQLRPRLSEIVQNLLASFPAVSQQRKMFPFISASHYVPANSGPPFDYEMPEGNPITSALLKKKKKKAIIYLVYQIIFLQIRIFNTEEHSFLLRKTLKSFWREIFFTCLLWNHVLLFPTSYIMFSEESDQQNIKMLQLIRYPACLGVLSCSSWTQKSALDLHLSVVSMLASNLFAWQTEVISIIRKTSIVTYHQLRILRQFETLLLAECCWAGCILFFLTKNSQCPSHELLHAVINICCWCTSRVIGESSLNVWKLRMLILIE